MRQRPKERPQFRDPRHSGNCPAVGGAGGRVLPGVPIACSYCFQINRLPATALNSSLSKGLTLGLNPHLSSPSAFFSESSLQVFGILEHLGTLHKMGPSFSPLLGCSHPTHTRPPTHSFRVLSWEQLRNFVSSAQKLQELTRSLCPLRILNGI